MRTRKTMKVDIVVLEAPDLRALAHAKQVLESIAVELIACAKHNSLAGECSEAAISITNLLNAGPEFDKSAGLTPPKMPLTAAKP
jgi:hypothetical protein